MGMGDNNCISQNFTIDPDWRDCKNYQWQTDTFDRCVEACPTGWYNDTTGYCEPCHEACNTCTSYDSALGAAKYLIKYSTENV